MFKSFHSISIPGWLFQASFLSAKEVNVKAASPGMNNSLFFYCCFISLPQEKLAENQSNIQTEQKKGPVVDMRKVVILL